MLIVKDLSKLEKYGFTHKGAVNNEGNPIWYKEVYAYDDACGGSWLTQYIEIVVNPLDCKNKIPKNQLVICCCLDCDTSKLDDKYLSLEEIFYIDVIFQMLTDGVLEYVKEE